MISAALNAVLPLIPYFLILACMCVLGLFLSFRADYSQYPERTRIAVKLTLSTITHVITLGRSSRNALERGERLPHQRRHGDPIDDGTISAPFHAVPDPRNERPPHHHPRHREADQ